MVKRENIRKIFPIPSKSKRAKQEAVDSSSSSRFPQERCVGGEHDPHREWIKRDENCFECFAGMCTWLFHRGKTKIISKNASHSHRGGSCRGCQTRCNFQSDPPPPWLLLKVAHGLDAILTTRLPTFFLRGTFTRPFYSCRGTGCWNTRTDAMLN